MGIIEKRAKIFCNEIELNGSKTFKVEWTKDRDNCYNARIMNHAKKIAHASGCGYCKLSAVLAESLQFLGKDIIAAGGCGERSVIKALAKYGWNLSSQIEDVYTIGRIKV